MPRKHQRRADARPYKSYTPEVLEECLTAIRSGNMTQRKASEAFKIPRRTIINRLRAIRQNKKVNPPGFPPIFTEEEETEFTEKIVYMRKFGFPVSELDLRVIIKAYLDTTGRKVHRFKNNFPGTEWVASFLCRRPDLSRRFAANIKRSRAAVDTDTLTEFIDNVKEAVDGVPASNIWNFDETNLTDDPGTKKVIIKRGTKYPELIRNSSKSAISLMICGNADGELLPVYVVYKAGCLWSTWTEGGPPGTRYNCSTSGWFDMNIFTDWFCSLFLPVLKKQPGKKVIICDNLSSHISVDVLRQCQENNIEFLCLPANSTHLTQPLDVAFFRPLKTAWRTVLTDWKSSNTGHKDAILPKSYFPVMLGRLMELVTPNSANNLKAGFRKCGLYPTDIKPLLERLPETTIGNIDREAINRSFLESLRDKRAEWTKGISAGRRKKLKIVPGKSVAEQLFESGPNGTPQSSGQQVLSEVTGEFIDDDEIPTTSLAITGQFIDDDEMVPTTSSEITGQLMNVDEIPTKSSRIFRRSASCESEASGQYSLRDSSEGSLGDLENVSPNIEKSSDLKLQPLKKKVGKYVIFQYEKELFPGVIIEVKNSGPIVSAMKRSLKNWKWPKPKDEMKYRWSDVLGCIDPPKKVGRREFYSIPELDHLWAS